MTWHGRISIDDPSARLRDADGRLKRSSLLSLFLPFFFFRSPPKLLGNVKIPRVFLAFVVCLIICLMECQGVKGEADGGCGLCLDRMV